MASLRIARISSARPRSQSIRWMAISALVEVAGRAMRRHSRPGQLLSAGPDHRLDELPVRVLVSALEELGQILTAVRGFVVHTGDIERPDRIVSRLNDVDSVEVQA